MKTDVRTLFALAGLAAAAGIPDALVEMEKAIGIVDFKTRTKPLPLSERRYEVLPTGARNRHERRAANALARKKGTR